MKKLFTFLTIMGFLLAMTGMAYSQAPTLTPIEELGKSIFFDKISSPDNQSCADCHGAKVGFTGPNPAINKKGAVYMGAVSQRFGNRKPPTIAYAGGSPVFHWDVTEEVWVGGMFWDGRATGDILGYPLADQAQGPFLNPLEQNNYDVLAVLTQIYYSDYAYMWEIVWGEPLSLDPADIYINYDLVALSIMAYENSTEVNPYTSKYDYYLAGEVVLTDQEADGLALFNGKGKCNLCHPSEGPTPLFTDFTYDNLGVPKNPQNPFYTMPSTINPLGEDWVDLGLGLFLQAAGHPEDVYETEMGKFKVPTLRNVDLRPGKGYTKAYTHNGVFKSLKEVVDFYNTRDVDPSWPDPEYAYNINTDELGDLGLTDEEVDAIVAFMGTLSDGFDPTKSAHVDEGSSLKEAAINALYPNPASAQITINLSANISLENRELIVYSMNGQRILTLPVSEPKILLDVSGFTSGIYFVKVNGLEGDAIHKFVKM
jgi:cytochrome c peroxidase